MEKDFQTSDRKALTIEEPRTGLRIIRRSVWVIRFGVCLSIAVLIGYWLSPLLDPATGLAKARPTEQFQSELKTVMAEVPAYGDHKFLVNGPASELIAIRAYYHFKYDPDSKVTQMIDDPTVEARVRPDRAILWAGLFVMLLIATFAIRPSTLSSLRSISVGSLNLEIEAPIQDGEQVSSAPTQDLPTLLFAKEVEVTAARADQLFERSTLLLIAGIVMAFIGVSIFYVTLPEVQKGEESLTFMAHAIRPMGVLIFIEAIAWFLLRQYRALIEDYKWFFRVYLKRANFLAAIRILGKSPVRHEDMFIAACLVKEDMSGRLKAGETTESLEALKLPDDNLITEMLKTITSALKTREEKVAKTVPRAGA